MDLGAQLLAAGSVALAAQSAYSAALMLYAWEDESKQASNRAPSSFEPPRLSFTILLPVRHEEAVIRDTIQRVVELNYPRELVQVLVVAEASDRATIAAVNDKLASMAWLGINHIRLVVFGEPPINKPHALNVGLAEARGEVVTIFDAEDEPHHDILQVANTVMLREGAPALQCGVQLMNYADKWYSALNVLEYFFWFKSRLHYHARQGMVPLGGNTAFIRRDVLEAHGRWDERCLTEDADLGIRLTAAGVPIRVLYDDRYVTREETPPTARGLMRQRTRWDQGFLQVLGKGDWLRLPGWRQRLLALYTLGFPLLQALMMLYLPISVWMMANIKMPVLVAMLSMAPFYAVGLQVAITTMGLYEFTAAHRLRASPLLALRLILVYLPYQWLLSYAALRAVRRQLFGVNNWEKTSHVGAHRAPALQPAMTAVAVSVEAPEPVHG